eukprot:scaffold13863_cov35-Tisochrysis_lutea.AAC.1
MGWWVKSKEVKRKLEFFLKFKFTPRARLCDSLTYFRPHPSSFTHHTTLNPPCVTTHYSLPLVDYLGAQAVGVAGSGGVHLLQAVRFSLPRHVPLGARWLASSVSLSSWCNGVSRCPCVMAMV